MILALTIGLYVVVAALLFVALLRRDGTARRAMDLTRVDFLHLLPRLVFGVIGAGFLARLLPQEAVIELIGPESGFRGLVAASLAGALTPGGPVVGFALGSAALKSGAGLPQVIAFVTAWSLFALNRMLMWELPIMPVWFVRLRIIVSLPVPLAAAGAMMLLG
jgi:uncharacterized membrane protein YraQ (UPF0718 family)